MIEKDAYYNSFKKNLVDDFKTNLKDNRDRVFSVGNSCLLAHTLSCIYKLRLLLFKEVSSSLELMPIGVVSIEFDRSFIEEDFEGINQYIPTSIHLFYLFVSLFLLWEQKSEVLFIEKTRSKNPYRAIIDIYRRGGYVYIYKGELRANEKVISKGFLLGEQSLILPSLEASFLNMIDNNFNEVYLPNQQEIDELYTKWLEANEISN